MRDNGQLNPDYSFGTGFSYAAWPANTTVSLHNVPWSADYRDVVKFPTTGDLDTYLRKPANAGPVIRGMTRARNVNIPIRISLPFHQVYQYNYLRASNGAQPIEGDGENVYYYFISDVRYVAGNTTELIIQLDVWQTFGHRVSFGNCYIERGHIGIANERQMENNGRDYLSIPEGLDIGAEYAIRANYSETIGQSDAASGSGNLFDIILASTVSLETSGGDVDNPVLNTASGSMFEGLPNGVQFYHFPTMIAFKDYMREVARTPWVSQGIISIMAVPSVSAAELEAEEVTTLTGRKLRVLKGSRIKPKRIKLAEKWRNPGYLPPRYQHLHKFFTHPYTSVELTTYSGNPLLLKPESMEGADLDVVLLMHLAFPNPRVVIYPFRYNGHHATVAQTNLKDGSIFTDNAEFLDMVTGIFDMPTFSTVNNAYTSFLASNRHGLAYQRQSADWSQQRTMAGNQLAFDQSGYAMGNQTVSTEQGIGAASATTALGIQSNTQRMMLSGATGVISGAAGGGAAGAAGGALSAATGAVGNAIDSAQANAQLGINSGLARAQNLTSLDGQGYNRDTNKAYADWAAKGDYQNAIASINARVQDAQMLQPSTSGQLGGDAFNLAMYQWAIHAKVKMLQGAAMASIGEYWLRYGYQINRFGVLPTSLSVMTKFTYWKLRETYIRSGRVPESFRLAIRGIFEKGVTVWVNPDDIGVIDIADNKPLPGVEL